MTHVTPKKAAQNLREWASAVAAAGSWYIPPLYGKVAYAMQTVFAIAVGLAATDKSIAINKLADFGWSAFCHPSPEALNHHILWLCFLADVIESEGTDWIQNA